MPLEVAQVVVALFELYALAGVVFAALFLPRAVARLDPRVAGAPRTLRLLILPGVAALWPLLAWRWIAGAPEPIERNPHRTKAGCAMIRPLRRRHRWIIPALLALLVVAAALALTHPAPSSRMDALPRPIVDLQRVVETR